MNEFPGKINYLIGNDPKGWHTNIPMFAKVAQHDLYPGVDVVYYGTQQQLEIVYAPTSLPAGVQNGDERDPSLRSGPALADGFRARLAEVEARELEQAVSLVGPHRDDFAFLLDGVDVGTYGSRGQQRLVVLALKLAEAEFMEGETGERPILLLDDVLSELDPARRAYVLERVSGLGQTIVTATNPADLSPSFLARAEVLRVTAGTVERESGVRSRASRRGA